MHQEGDAADRRPPSHRVRARAGRLHGRPKLFAVLSGEGRDILHRNHRGLPVGGREGQGAGVLCVRRRAMGQAESAPGAALFQVPPPVAALRPQPECILEVPGHPLRPLFGRHSVGAEPSCRRRGAQPGRVWHPRALVALTAGCAQAIKFMQATPNAGRMLLVPTIANAGAPKGVGLCRRATARHLSRAGGEGYSRPLFRLREVGVQGMPRPGARLRPFLNTAQAELFRAARHDGRPPLAHRPV